MPAAPWNFINAYVTTLLWSTNDDEGEPMDSRFDISDLAQATRKQVEADAHKFYNANHVAINCLGAPVSKETHDCDSRAGHDFALTRNQHGAGFWDGDWPEPYASQLSDAADAFGEFNLYVGDDGKLHH